MSLGWYKQVCRYPNLYVNLIHHVAALRESVLHAIFLYLHNSYKDLDRLSFLGILEGYGVGPRALILHHRYWERLNMVACAGGYYVSPFRKERIFTQGNPLLPTIFNVLV